MSDTVDAAGDTPAASAPDREHELAAAVLSGLLREDYGGLSRRVRYTPAGPVLDLPGSGAFSGGGHLPGGGLAVPLEPDGFLADFRVSRAAPPLKLGDVEAAVAAVSDEADAAGVVAFGDECREALAALRLRDTHFDLGDVAWRARRGLDGAVGYDALGAVTGHPAYPTSACKLGFTDEDHLRYAPEYLPEFELNWVAVPKTALRHRGDGLPAWWPSMPEVGLPAPLAVTHGLLPAHPLAARRVLSDIYEVIVAPGTAVRVRPTLSVRTVAVTAAPGTHVKLPLPASTLGLRNRRDLPPRVLADGALVHQVLADVLAADNRAGHPRAGHPPHAGTGDAGTGGAGAGGSGGGTGRSVKKGLNGLLIADDGTYLHAGHRFLGCLVRRLPAGLSACHVVPVAALLAPCDAAGGLVIDRLAGEAGTSVAELTRAWFDLVFRIAVRLFVRYGIALESHQQNAALVLDPAASGAPANRLRLLVKDFDGALINHRRLASALGDRAPAVGRFADERILTDSDEELADVFTTITVHLCAGALAFGLAARDRGPLADLLTLARESLGSALSEYGGDPAARLLRDRVLGPLRLPGKAMLTACTLADKARTGARDVNKYIGTSGPNYLREPGGGW